MSDEPLVILRQDDGLFFVSQGELFADGLSFDEMLGLTSAVMMPVPRPCVHWLRTAAQNAAILESVELTDETKQILSVEDL